MSVLGGAVFQQIGSLVTNPSGWGRLAGPHAGVWWWAGGRERERCHRSALPLGHRRPQLALPPTHAPASRWRRPTQSASLACPLHAPQPAGCIPPPRTRPPLLTWCNVPPSRSPPTCSQVAAAAGHRAALSVHLVHGLFGAINHPSSMLQSGKASALYAEMGWPANGRQAMRQILGPPGLWI